MRYLLKCYIRSKKGGHMKPLQSLSIMLLTISFTEVNSYAANTISIEEAAKKKLIKLSIKAKGGHLGNVITLNIKNLSTKKLDLALEAGRILDSKNNNEQDLIVTQAQALALAGNQTKEINVSVMCCQAHKGNPKENADYLIGKIGDSSLVKLARFIDKNKYTDSPTAQQAMWCLSDNNSLASISGGTSNDINALQKYVSQLTGKPIPNYSIKYNQGNNNDVLGSAQQIQGIFEYMLPYNCHATLGIYDRQGKLIQLIFENISHQKGNYDVLYTFRTANLPRGLYIARMNADGHLHKEMEIEF